MAGPLRLVLGGVLLFGVLVVGLYAYRSLMLWGGRTPEGYQLLTPMPGSTGFEPSAQPSGPVLESQSSTDLAVNFGYKVGGIPWSYSLVLEFKRDADKGRAILTVRHSNRSASSESETVRRWDVPRKAFAVALADTFDIEPKAPALCLKAVIGPNKTRYDLSDGSICIAQRDASGQCHPETLACGIIRQ